MNTAIKTLTLFITAALLFTAACQNASDDTDPNIFDLRVDGVAVQMNGGNHQLGTIARFEMNLNDNRDLAEFEVNVGGALDYTENLEGSTASIIYDFTIDADTYNIGDVIQIIFIVEDSYGNIGREGYFATVVE